MALMRPGFEEQLVCGFALFAFLVLVWAFPYFPTQDGPAHLANSLILKDYGDPENRFEEFYRIAWRPLPNWTCFVLLAGFSHIMPPLAAEKLLVSLYVVGFAWSYRYFLKAIGESSPWLVTACLLLVFNRCLWMGFYNYCLSLILFFGVLGYFLRRWERFDRRHALALALLLCCTFFTHLFGFILAAGACLWLSLTLPPLRRRKLVLLCAAMFPGAVLSLIFFAEAHFFEPAGFGKLGDHLSSWVSGIGQWERVRRDIVEADKEAFGIYTDTSDFLAAGVVVLCGGFLAAYLWEPRGDLARRRVTRSLLGLGLVIALLYFLVPNFLTIGKGGFWKARLVILPPLLLLGCCGATSLSGLRHVLHLLILLLLGYQLISVGFYLEDANRMVSQFTAGVGSVGGGKVLYVHNGSRKLPNMAVNPLRHADDYYCLDSRNVNLGPHFATLRHSVVRLRPPIEEVRDHFNLYSNRHLVELVLVWDAAKEPAPKGFHVAYRRGRLTVWERDGD